MADQYADYALSVDCPHCGEATYITGRALAESGIVPREFHRCDHCKERFETQATIDIGVNS